VGVGKRGALFMIAAGVCLAAPLSSCLDATEIVVQLSTDVACATVAGTKVLIHIGSPSTMDNPPTHIESTTCFTGDATSSSANDLGTVAVLPSGGFDDAIAITVALSNDSAHPTSECFPESPQSPTSCIYAHRQISFLPHTKVTLPIALGSLCAGVSCTAPQTCNPDTGKCDDGTVDPRDCGTSCSTGDGGGLPDVIITKDVTVDVVADAPWNPDVAADAPCLGSLCNGKCVDILTDKSNCGACYLDCSNGSCSNGLCRLDVNAGDAATTVLNGSCLALYNNNVYVSTTSGLAKIPINGGSPAFVSSSKAYTLAAYPGELAWIWNGTETTITDYVSATVYGQSSTNAAAFMAMSQKGYVWSDYGKGAVLVQPVSGGNPLTYYQGTQQQLAIPVAAASTNVYWTTPTGGIYYSTGSAPTNVAVGNPGAIIVDDPTSTQPTVYVVTKSNTVQRYDYKLVSLGSMGTSTLLQLGAIAWDGATIYANGLTEIQKISNSTFVTVAKAPNNTDPRCLAVDSSAVYWLESGGNAVYKHAK